MPDNAWSLIFDPKYAAKLKGCGVNFLDSASEVLPVAMLYVGKPAYSTNAADYDAAAAMLKACGPSSRASRRPATSTTWPAARSAR